MSKHRRPAYLPIVIIAVVIIVIAAAVIVWFKPDSQRMETAQSASIASADTSESTLSTALNSEQTEQTASAQNQSAFVTGLERLPRSLKGTQVDGEIIIDEHKQLVVTEGLRRLFDYFLSALGEEEEAVIFARVERYIRHHTPEPAASQAVAIFGNYVAYLKALPDIEKRYGNLQLQASKSGELDLNAVAQQKQEVASLRQQYFDKTTIEAFFGAEDNYDDYSIEMVRINQNEQMSEAQKQAARQDYVSRLPDGAIKTNILQQANLNELMIRTERMKAAGASPEALYNMRRELVGVPAAERLAQVDQEDADFDQRFQQLQSQKQQILAQTTDKAKAQTQITQLEKQLFNDAERKRLTGYAALQKSEIE
ncbi:lipase secretion chaperone [uncultured Psychrobacter sp.]|uniref:lipase secretion chaperone n=1 Tax=uncultured Psychrobacter sp. TaxID=259303 RepID=UPI0026056723|nr:lipase secretion chaperone [uncultured Psychrobacter sp.]